MRTSPLEVSWRKESKGTPVTLVLSQMTSRIVLARIADSSESQNLSLRFTLVCVKKYLEKDACRFQGGPSGLGPDMEMLML